VLRAALALATVATLFAAVDLAHKASTDATYFHDRTAGYIVVVLALATAWTAGILATRSLSMAIGGGVLAGGALGNLVSLALWPGVPNPIVVEPMAFNLADVFVLSGFVLTACATLIFAARNRERLREPVRLR
jgi:lipoprotein signal peptidase